MLGRRCGCGYAARPAPVSSSPIVPIAPATVDARAPLRRSDLRSIFVAIICTGAGQTFYFAIISPLGRELRLSELQIGLIITLASLVYMVSSPIWGRVSDHWGRRRVILFGLLSYAVMASLFGFGALAGLSGLIVGTAAFIMLAAIRIGFALTAGATYPAAQAYIADTTLVEHRTRAVGLLGAAFGIGTIAGPGAAALLAGLGLVTPIFAVSSCVLAAAVGCFLFVRSLPPRAEPGVRHRFLRLPDGVWPLLAVGTCVFSTTAAIPQVTGFRVQDTQLLDAAATAQMAGFALAISAVGSVLVQAGLIQILRWSPRRLLLLGSTLGVAGGVVLTVTDSYAALLVGVALMGLAFGLINPGYTAGLTLSASATEQGTVAGLNGMVQGLGYVIGPMIGGGLYGVAPTLPYAICGALMATSLLLTALFVRLRPITAPRS
ncbi:MAG: MFS transporter [Alphaproteobacteria bacterium]|nr:MFS transporter [Alphaproteobacteria bacterium]